MKWSLLGWITPICSTQAVEPHPEAAVSVECSSTHVDRDISVGMHPAGAVSIVLAAN